MIVEIKVPELGESINEVEIGEWLVQIGDTVQADEEIVAIESDKATVEVPAPAAGVLVKILKEQGATAVIGEVVGHIDTAPDGQKEMRPTTGEGERQDARTDSATNREEAPAKSAARVMPAAARILAQHNVAADTVTPTGPGDRILKEDARRAVTEVASPEKIKEEQQPLSSGPEGELEAAKERRVPMTPIRRTIAARLLEARQAMALLTTFNEVDMSEVKRVRSLFGQQFADKFGVKLGFMSFFIKAAVTALGDFPLVNAAIDGRDIVYHDSCDIGVAIGGGKGLVVPVLRHAERMGFAEIEKKIAEFAKKARNNSLTMEELTGGTFTISNGGVYGSMLSTPIVNPPQSAILGLHAIQDRPVAIGGEVRIRPIMYLAVTYDHRIIDGREAVSFLKSIKERIEAPQKLFLEI
ncbi:2-oxoglutarate dehydrogenase complex dihydrolipoyllysine-residue succinyltransferase [Desulfopila sp. IMCC35006]|uniref:2-oxoglutarate dehydrogenase complex dihydrolipoyllysine-residue succinyltransferase n=1 Tax=Desulfopila sp. IMCC35006 TaxID=2569542 RepID=UPI0010AD4C95|nr:2-oxoglutarate dehydrogenase complex dihydrolipoyllysine-residue succinyltransferase [Desulfopila sp. IMCC35006]TKB24589.1 2-oxoglutarate dehydrogenase complex dihydrolipoyllysine-residue succinyltransferase [Desulfopila sp. IMCC35006]